MQYIIKIPRRLYGNENSLYKMYCTDFFECTCHSIKHICYSIADIKIKKRLFYDDV